MKLDFTTLQTRRERIPAGDSKAWFALYVQVRHEKEVLKRLEGKALEGFLPLVECASKRKDRKIKLHVPLFPGYVLVNTVMDGYTH
ncbi:MAG: transcription termination/antitermination NusG family protein, partial [Acidobacteriota bacterium]